GRVGPAPAWHTLQKNRPGPDPLQPQHTVADALHHPADDSVPALMDDHSKHGPIRLIAYGVNLGLAAHVAIDRAASGTPVAVWAGWMAIQEHLVLLLELIARMHDPVRECAVVRHQQEPGRWTV